MQSNNFIRILEYNANVAISYNRKPMFVGGGMKEKHRSIRNFGQPQENSKYVQKFVFLWDENFVFLRYQSSKQANPVALQQLIFVFTNK